MTARSERTRAAIKDAFLALLETKAPEDVSMTELARAAGISRSTLYGHFANVNEIYDACFADFCQGLRSLTTHLHCGDCLEDVSGASRPFCIALRDAGKYRALVRTPAFMAKMFAAADEDFADPDASPADVRARRTLYRFQMSGCYAVALDETIGDDWGATQQLLDAYIRAGRHATT